MKYLILFVVAVWGHHGEVFVSKMLDEGHPPERVRKAAEVTLAGVKGYSGYFTTDERHNTNSFFWYLPAVDHPETAPVFFWFPGWNTSSAMAIFEESGPYRLVDGGIVRTKKSWHQFCHAVYMDKMPGEGFTFTDSKEGLPRDTQDVTELIYRGILEFFRLFDHLRRNELYIGGESMGSQASILVAREIYAREPPVNLKGLVFVCPYLDYMVQTNHYTFFQNFGLMLSRKQGLAYRWLENIGRNYVKENRFSVGSYIIHKSSFLVPGTFARAVTGRTTHSSILYDAEIPVDWPDLLGHAPMRDMIHAGDRPLNTGVAYVNKWEDWSHWKTIHDILPDITATYRTLFLFGLMDIIVPYSESGKMVHSCGGKGFENITRKVLRSKTGGVAAYWRGDDRLAEVLLTNHGHHGTSDQPLRAASILKSFLLSKPYQLDAII